MIKHDAGSSAAVDDAMVRVVRTLAVAFAIGSVVFAGLAAPEIIAQASEIAPWWSTTALILVFVIPLAMGAGARWWSLRTIRLLARVLALGFLLSMASLVPALPGGHLPAALGSPWILGVTALGTTAAAIAWRPRLVWGFAVVTSTTLALDRVWASASPIAHIAWQDGLYSLTFDCIFAGLALITIRAGRALDTATMAARRETTLTASAIARARQRARAEALLHDGVLATLLAAGRMSEAAGAAITRQAESTLGQLDDFRTGARQRDLDGREFIWRQQSIATELTPEARFSYDLIASDRVPGEVVQAFAEATSESLKNSARHAGTDDHEANRAVHVRCLPDRVTVTVLDDGRGFDPGSIITSRLGISVSIRGRMASLPGGRASVVSIPGEGTRIYLEWRRA